MICKTFKNGIVWMMMAGLVTCPVSVTYAAEDNTGGTNSAAQESTNDKEAEDPVISQEIKEEGRDKVSQKLEIQYDNKTWTIENHTAEAQEFYVKSSDSDDWGENLLQECRKAAGDLSGSCDLCIVGEEESYRYLGLALSEISDVKLYKTEDGEVYVTYQAKDGKEVSTEAYPCEIYEEPRVMYATNSVYIRAIPDLSGEQLSSVGYGSENKIYGQTGSESSLWYLIRTGNSYGYTFGDYYSETKPSYSENSGTWTDDYDYDDYDYNDYDYDDDEDQVLINCDGSLDDGSVNEEDIY